MTNDRLLTSRQASQMLGIDEGTLANWRYRGKGPPYVKKDERWVRYWESDIKDWAENDKVYPEKKRKA